MLDTLIRLDGSILVWIQQNLRQEWFTPFVLFYTKLGGVALIWVIMSLIMCFIPKTRKIGFTAAGALVCAFLVNNILVKNLVARTRPYEVVEGLMLIGKKATDFSFPSGHSSSAFAFAAVICLYVKKKGICVLVIISALLMAFTRLYIGIHYPTDVLAGAVSGALCGVISVFVMNKAGKYLPFIQE